MAEDYLPIIYVRGYAGTQSEVEETVDDPFYGFNKGSTHVRVGPNALAQFFAFESPLVRLMSDHGYCEVFEGERRTAQLLKAENRAKRTTVNHSPLPLAPGKGTKGQRYHRYTAFLMPSNSTAPDKRTCRHVLGLRFFRFHQVNSFFRFAGHLEQVPLWSDWLLLDVTPPAGTRKSYVVECAWRSEGKDPSYGLENRIIPLPMTAHAVLGSAAVLELVAEPWT